MYSEIMIYFFPNSCGFEGMGDRFDLIIPPIWKAKILRLVRLAVEAI